MAEDEGFNRFFSFMNLFVFFMLLLVMGANFLVMFIGWEGVGLCSYLLIGFWFKNDSYNRAARKAFVMNRIGDLGFLLALFLIFITFHSLTFSTIFPLALNFHSGNTTLLVITLLLFVGATGKSAQIPLYTWLPDAMAGPTPVSALIHAATMVTAGIYMVARSNILFVLSPVTMQVIGITGLATALLAGLVAIFQNDIKKVLAYSTISQLGYMFLALSVGAFNGAMFHLTTHAFFKALLFLAAGSVIHGLGGEQDVRKMGGLRGMMPKTFWVFFIGTLAISGIPPLSGFFSKDAILDHVFESNRLLWGLAVIGSMMTAFYMFRLFFLVFWKSYHGMSRMKGMIHESSAVMMVPLLILAALSVLGGWLNCPDSMGGPMAMDHYLAPVFADAANILAVNASPLSMENEWALMGGTLLLILLTAGLAYYQFMVKHTSPALNGGPVNFFHRLFENKFYIDELYGFIVERPVMWCSRVFHQFIELKVIDRFINEIGSMFILAGNGFRYVQTGHVGFYLFIMVIGVIVALFFNTGIF
jgi:NADH-quinone oxidoreductase subunit L